MGGEVYFYITITGNKISGRFMDYVFRQGNDTSKVFADGSNLLTVTKKQQSDSIYTAILPRGKGEQVSSGSDGYPDGYGRRIDISGVTWSKSSGKQLDKPSGSKILEDPDATAKYGHINGSARLYLTTFDEIEDPNVLIQQAYQTLMSINHPLVEYSATVAKVGNLSLGDTVFIMHSDRDLSYKTRVFEVKYDLLNPEMTELSLGDNLSSNSITSQINQLSGSIATNSNQVQWSVANGGHNNTTFGALEPPNPKKGDVWFKSLPNGNTEEYYFDSNIWVLGAKTDQQWQENRAVSQGENTTFYGTATPIGAVIGDVWFKNDNNEPDGKSMYTYSGTVWVKFTGAADASRLQIGTIDAAKINVMNISAENIVTGKLSADFIKGGQLDFAQINGININANNITTGSISGANLNINLNTGSVVFQKGRIYSSDYTTDINIDSGYIATSSSTTKAILRQGRLQLVDPNYIDPNTVPYLDISNLGGGLGNTYTFGALVTGRDNITLSNSANKTPLLSGIIGVEQLAGIFAGRGNDGTWYPTRVGGANRGVIISGGNNTTSDIIDSSPYIFVGVQEDLGTQFGNRILIHGELVHIPSAYKHTSSSSANVVVSNDGALVRSSSASKYKLDIKNDVDLEDSLKLIEVPLSTWVDKHEHDENGSNERYFGMIAEDLRDAGLEYLVQYGDDNEVEGINYDRVALLLIPLVKKLKDRIEELERKGK